MRSSRIRLYEDELEVVSAIQATYEHQPKATEVVRICLRAIGENLDKLIEARRLTGQGLEETICRGLTLHNGVARARQAIGRR